MSFLPLTQLPTVRRLVTGHNDKGTAIFEFDEKLQPFDPYSDPSQRNTSPGKPLGVTLIHRTRGTPVKVQGGEEELGSENVRRGRGEPGIVCQIVDLPPDSSDKQNFLHRNQSLDYGVILKGSMDIVLDNGETAILREGDVYVQKGTIHAWKNTSSDYCRFLTVIIPSEKVKIAETGEFLEVTKIPALSD